MPILKSILIWYMSLNFAGFPEIRTKRARKALKCTKDVIRCIVQTE